MPSESKPERIVHIVCSVCACEEVSLIRQLESMKESDSSRGSVPSCQGHLFS